MITQSNIKMKNDTKSCNVKWMLHGNVYQNGYGKVVVGRYGGCFKKDVGLCVGEQDKVLPRGWMYWRSMHQASIREGIAQQRRC